MPKSPVQHTEVFFGDMRDIHATGGGDQETSYYAPLANLLNALGGELKPKVRCVLQLKNRGAGKPDGGLFTADQFRKGRGSAPDADPLEGQPPSRGVIEVKSPDKDLSTILQSEQVEKYWSGYGLVVVTNYRQFAVVGSSPGGQPVLLEEYTLADSATVFWRAVGHPRALAEQHGERFAEYLRRVMLYAAPLTAPSDLAWFLASYARDARTRLENTKLPALAAVRKALEQALGVTFQGPKGEHFFRSTLVQTLFYGIFAAWVLWCRKRQAAGAADPPSEGLTLHEAGATYDAGPDKFQWQAAAWSLRVPVIRALFEQLAAPSKLEPLGLAEVMDWAAAALNRVDPAAFFASFDEGEAVQYFYEPFLEAFDPELRKELGVWYTPPEIVRYMVARVDTVLRDELGLPDGLADPRVVVLDPCCGTGAYLVEVLKRIAHNLRERRGDDALIPHDVKRAASERVFGFEIMPAPFVVAHLQLGLFLRRLGAPLDDAVVSTERAGVFLTNALTGWEPPKQPKEHLPFPEFEDERDTAERIKQESRILVILGNPPYNGYAGMAVDEERELSAAYREARRAPQPRGQGLNDLYVRFFRMAERRIVEKSGQGVVCLISNYSWLDGLSFTAMREQYLEKFDRIWIDNLNGDKYRTGKLTPEGDPDPSVFSTRHNREGIQVGTAIALLARRAVPETPAESATRTADVRFRDLWGRDKREQLLASLTTEDFDEAYTALRPEAAIGFPLAPAGAGAAYLTWPLLPELFPVSFPGVKTSRDQAVVDIDRDRLEARLRRYFDPEVGDEEIRATDLVLMRSTGRFKAQQVRHTLRRRGFLPDNIVRYCYRPFDVRWLYWEPETKLLDEKRAECQPYVSMGNIFLTSRQKGERAREGSPFYVTRHWEDHHLTRPGNSVFPLFSQPHELPGLMADLPACARRTNLAAAAINYMAGLELGAVENEDLLLMHALAIGHSPLYLSQNAGALRQDWPRIPLPGWSLADSASDAAFADPARAALEASAALGRRVAALLDPETPVPGVTEGAIRSELCRIAVIARSDDKPLNPTEGDLALTAGWGHAGAKGVVMPGRGKAPVRPLLPDESPEELGPDTVDVFLNEHAYWRNVPRQVWEFTLGGYQVLKKWLSYRERDLLGRDLKVEEVREVTAMTRRLAALVLLRPELDANYCQIAELDASSRCDIED